jgi:two-component system chemotaxis response regulator CheY
MNTEKKVRALAVDDDPAFLDGLRLMLRLSGFVETDTASDAETAWEMAQRGRYDLIVSDWNMDPVDGLELLRRVRAHRRIGGTPFILVTASLSEDAWRDAIVGGASDFLNKPFTVDQIRVSAQLAVSTAPRLRDNVVVLSRARRALRGERIA